MRVTLDLEELDDLTFGGLLPDEADQSKIAIRMRILEVRVVNDVEGQLVARIEQKDLLRIRAALDGAPGRERTEGLGGGRVV